VQKWRVRKARLYVMVGDGSLPNDVSGDRTSIQEKQKLTIVLLNNDGYFSIGSLSSSLGS